MSVIDDLLKLLKASDNIAADLVRAIEPVLTSPAFDNALSDAIRNADVANLDEAIEQIQKTAADADGLTHQAKSFLTGNTFKRTLEIQIHGTRFLDDGNALLAQGKAIDLDALRGTYSNVSDEVFDSLKKSVDLREETITSYAGTLTQKYPNANTDELNDYARELWVWGQEKTRLGDAFTEAMPAMPTSVVDNTADAGRNVDNVDAPTTPEPTTTPGASTADEGASVTDEADNARNGDGGDGNGPDGGGHNPTPPPPGGGYKAPETVLPKPYRNFLQQLTRLHYSNWGWGDGFANLHIKLMPGVKAIGNLTKGIPNIFTGVDFIRPLVKDLDNSIKNSGIIGSAKSLDDQLQEIARQVGNNKLKIDEAKIQIRQAFDNFAEQNQTQLSSLAENTDVRLKELEAIEIAKDKYHGTERLSAHQKEIAIKYINDINGMAGTMAKTGDENEILVDFLENLDAIGNDRGAFEIALKTGSTDRMSRIGAMPELRLAGWKGDPANGLARPSLADERALERSLTINMYQRNTRFTALAGSNNAELTMGRLESMYKGKPRDAAGRIDWDVEDFQTLAEYARALYTAGSPHEAARAIRITQMHMGMSASDTMTEAFWKAVTDTRKDGSAHYKEFVDDMQRTWLDDKDAPFKFGPRYAEKMIADPYEYFTYGWAFPLPEKGNTRLFGLPQSGIPGAWNRTQYISNLQTKAKAYLLGGTTENLPGTKPGQLDELKVVYAEGQGANPLRGLGNVARDGLWKPIKFLSTGGMSSAHIRWGTVAAIEATALLVGGAKAVEWATEKFGWGENGEGWDTGLEWSLPIDAATYTTRTGISALTGLVTLPMDDDNQIGQWIRDNANLPEGETILSGVNYFLGNETESSPSNDPAATPTTLSGLQSGSEDNVDTAKDAHALVGKTLTDLAAHLAAFRTAQINSIQNVIDNSASNPDRLAQYTALKTALEARLDAYDATVATNGAQLLPLAQTAFDGIKTQDAIIQDNNTLVALANIAWSDQAVHIHSLNTVAGQVSGADTKIRAELDAIKASVLTSGTIPAIVLTPAERAAADAVRIAADAKAADDARIAADAAAALALQNAEDANTAAQTALAADPDNTALQAAAAKAQADFELLNVVEIARLKAVEDARIAADAKADADAKAADAARLAALTPDQRAAEAAAVVTAARAADPLYDEHKGAASSLTEATAFSSRIGKLHGSDTTTNSAAFLVAGMKTQQADKITALSEEMFDKGDHNAVTNLNELLANVNGNNRAAQDILTQLAANQATATALQTQVSDLNTQIQGITALSGKGNAQALLATLEGKTDALKDIKEDSETLHKQIEQLVSDNSGLIQANPEAKHHFGTGGAFSRGAIAAGGGEYGLLNQFLGSEAGGTSVIGGYFNMAGSKLKDGMDWWSEAKRGARTQGEMNGYNLAEQGFLAFMSIVALNKIGEWTGMSRGVKIAALIGIVGYFIHRSGATGQAMRDNADARNPFAQINPSLRGRNNLPSNVQRDTSASTGNTNGATVEDRVVTLTGADGNPVTHQLPSSNQRSITAQGENGGVPQNNVVDIRTARTARDTADQTVSAGQGDGSNVINFDNRSNAMRLVANGETPAGADNLITFPDMDGKDRSVDAQSMAS